MRDSLATQRRSPLSPFEESNRTHWSAYIDIYRLSLAVFVVVGFGLRVWNLGAAPLWIDESFTTWAAKNFLNGQGFSDPVGSTSPYRRGWLTTTLPISAMFALLGPTEFAARVPSAVFGTIVIVVVYLLGSQFHRQVGLLAAMLAALDPFMIVWAREARMYVHLQLIYVLAIYLLYRWRSHGFRFRSRYPVGLVGVGLLGLGTHKAFLSFGGVFLVFMAVVLIRQAVLAIVDASSRQTSADVALRAAVLFVGGLAIAGGYAFYTDIPSVLTASTPAQWPARGPLYYAELFVETYPILWILGVAGLVYLLFADEQDQLVAFAFIIPFLVASATAQKSPRYVYFLLPLFFCLAVVPAVRFGRLLLGGLARRVRSGKQSKYRHTAVSMLLIFALVVTPPAATLAVPNHVNDPPFHPPRSDYDEASAFVAEHDDGTAVIMSTRPELSMWYLGETDYFFRQNGLKQVEPDGDRLVHTRTGTVMITNQSDLEAVMADGRPIWLMAGKKFRQGFTSPAMRNYVRAHFIAIEKDSWHNMVLYYWSPYLNQRSFSDPDAVDTTTGNAFVASFDGREYLALGRTTDTTVRHGVQGDALHGQATLQVPVRPDQPVILRTRTYGADDGDRFVTVSVSTDGEHWREVSRNDDARWAVDRVVIPAEDVDSDVLYVRFEGGSDGQNEYGGLVDYVQVYSVRDWERAFLSGAGNTTADGITVDSEAG